MIYTRVLFLQVSRYFYEDVNAFKWYKFIHTINFSFKKAVAKFRQPQKLNNAYIDEYIYLHGYIGEYYLLLGTDIKWKC